MSKNKPIDTEHSRRFKSSCEIDLMAYKRKLIGKKAVLIGLERELKENPPDNSFMIEALNKRVEEAKLWVKAYEKAVEDAADLVNLVDDIIAGRK